ncbi:family A G protein-coupled receptor-like protein [Hypoxylon rubiginosum]|uniref:Family A G protein-coupled receptor-like protein n=1 Tax=Hypoxylon rubiginosum TaxID=110542 RepID=A0ACC0DK10_9PEZI|nr:family A G protein-coupled receptor-like protein [Hypoxylon rubiginosum]
MYILPRNEALDVNPPQGNEELTTHGSDWLWAVFGLYMLFFFIFFATSFFAKSGEKIFHYLFTIALLVGSLTYFAVASDLGWEVITVADSKPSYANGGVWTRQVFWVEYVNWVVSFPVIVISLGLLSGISWASIVFNVFLSWTWVITLLVSAFTGTRYKWGFFAIGCLAWFILAFNTLFYGVAGAKRVGVARDYIILAGYLNFFWMIYPIAWGIADGGNKIGVTPGYIFYGILDLCVVPVLAFAFYFLSSKWDYTKLNIAFTRYGRVPQTGEFPEKTTPAPAAAAPPVVEPTPAA